MGQQGKHKSTPVILIADDEPDLRAMLAAHLARHTCVVIEARNGEEALENILVEEPNLVILDVMMPEINGWEICKYVRQKPALQDVRIIMVTAIGERVNSLTSPLYGADAYLDKPFQFSDLDAQIAEVFKPLGINWPIIDDE